MSDLKPTQPAQTQSAQQQSESTRPRQRGGEKYRGFWPADDREGGKGRSRRRLIIVGGAAAVLLAAAAVVGVVGFGDTDKPAGDAAEASGALPLAYVGTKSSPDLAKLNNRAQDARALTVDEVFPKEAKRLEAEGYQFNLVGTNLARDCARAAWGPELHVALRKYGCNQVIRGVYATKDAKHAGQFAVVNVNQVQDAHELLRNLDPRAKDGFIKPLTAPAVKKFGTGFSAAYVQASGHYVLVVWVQRMGGANPSSMNELVNASLAIQKADEFVWQRLTLVE